MLFVTAGGGGASLRRCIWSCRPDAGSAYFGLNLASFEVTCSCTWIWRGWGCSALGMVSMSSRCDTALLRPLNDFRSADAFDACLADGLST